MILFLDFDGVMHPVGCSVDLYFCHLALLESWLRQRPGVEVVISSSWREQHPLDELRGFFSEDIQASILGATPVLARDNWKEFGGEMPPMRFERELEVNRWLVQSGEPWRPWVALDDQAWRYKPFNARIVCCDGAIGLTQRELDRADLVLQGDRSTSS